MRKALILAGAAVMLVGAKPPVIPRPFHGDWVLVAGNCTDGLQMEGVLSIKPNRIAYGEIQMALTAVRKVSKVQIGVDTRNGMEGGDLAPWTTTTLLTLTQGGQRLTFDKTRHNGRLLVQRSPEYYKRCP